MKFVYSLLAVFALCTTQVSAQTIQASQNQLSFGNVFENAPLTLPVTLTNNLGYPVEVTNIRFFNTYGAPAFSADQSRFTIANGATHTVQVTFTPQHNIAHNTEMVLETNSKGGNISIDLTGQGKYSKTYYNSTENLSEEQLKTAL
ncbi:MAG: hypothetical protein LPJ89_05780, partial [Hymenobacteraceae bacterium]|nr:hypothetical protein [Hymenobacteraceae bacterium]